MEKLLYLPQFSKWVSPDSVFRDCPGWIQNGIPFSQSDRSPIYGLLCEQLELPQWRAEVNLEQELVFGVSQLEKTTKDNTNLVARYVLKALKYLIPLVETPNADVSWVRSILKLPIFPVISKDGARKLTSLGPNVFVPDFGLLNSLFQKKVDCIDAPISDIWALKPVLKLSDLSQGNYVSSYNDPRTMNVRIVGTVADVERTMEQLRVRRPAILRFVLHQWCFVTDQKISLFPGWAATIE